MTQPDSTPAEAATDEPDTGQPDAAAEVEKWKSLARKHEAAAKANTKAAERLAALEQSQMTETQRLEQAVADANKAREDSLTELMRLRVALRYGIADEDLDLLGSGSEEQIEARAERIAAKNAAAAAPATPALASTARRPAEVLRAGASPDPMPLNGDQIEQSLRAKLGIT